MDQCGSYFPAPPRRVMIFTVGQFEAVLWSKLMKNQ